MTNPQEQPDLVGSYLNSLRSLAMEEGISAFNLNELNYVLCVGRYASEEQKWVTIKALGKIFRQAPSTVSPSVDKLVDIGLFEKHVADDKRSRYLTLTIQGREYYQRLEERLKSFNQKGMRIDS